MAACLTLLGTGSAVAYWQLSRTALSTGEQAKFAEAKAMPTGLYENCDLTLYEKTHEGMRIRRS
jgi:hypothetical protein